MESGEIGLSTTIVRIRDAVALPSALVLSYNLAVIAIILPP